MESKVTTKRTAAKMQLADNEPFADRIDTVPAKKSAVKKTDVPSARVKPSKKAVRSGAMDPFAEVADAVSPVKKRASKKVKAAPKKTTAKTEKNAISDGLAMPAKEPKVELSPAFKALAEPVLPELGRENRARLQMQSPGKLFFYWSVRENPYQLLRDAFGIDTGSYMLVLKLTNLRRDTEEIIPAEPEGNWWFDVEPGCQYQAEIGFHAPNRPYFRVLYSNTVETPRRSPSPRVATDADWKVSAYKFAEVLDVAGFTQDAFDVAMAGDDYYAAEEITYVAFTRLIGAGDYNLRAIAAEDIRYAMIALASGVGLSELRWRISPALFAILQANAGNLGSGKAMSALTEYFDIDETEFSEEQFGPAVFGASLVHFPRTLKTRTIPGKYAPVSSHNFR